VLELFDLGSQSALAVLAWYSFLGACLYALQKLTRCFSQLSIFSVFVGFLVLRHGITVPFDDRVNVRVAGIVLSEQALTRFYISLVLMNLGVIGGASLGRLFFGGAWINPVAFRVQCHNSRAGVNVRVFVGLLFVCLGLIAFTHLDFKVNLWTLLSGGLTGPEYREMRETYGAATAYSSGLLLRTSSILRFGVLPLFLFTLYFLRQRSWLWNALFFLVLGLGLAVGLASGQKSAAVFLASGLVLAGYLKRGRRHADSTVSVSSAISRTRIR
jgi:hypothetical protein